MMAGGKGGEKRGAAGGGGGASKITREACGQKKKGAPGSILVYSSCRQQMGVAWICRVPF
jgi:hypothetical protein